MSNRSDTPTTVSTPVVTKILRLQPEMAEAISDFRHEHRIKSEADAFRRILAVGLEQRQLELEKVLADLLQRIDGYREQEHIPTREEAIRQLVQDALAAKQASPG